MRKQEGNYGRFSTRKPDFRRKNAKKLEKSFGKRKVVDGVSFFVDQGEIVGLLGPNGAGKSTTIAMLLGLIIPTCGKVEIFGVDMLKTRHAALAHMNFSSPYSAR